MNLELLKREDEARVEMMESLAAFTKEVAAGKASPEQISYMAEVAKLVDTQRYDKLRSAAISQLDESASILRRL